MRSRIATGAVGALLLGDSQNERRRVNVPGGASQLSILAENRSKARARFCLHLFKGEPERGRGAVIASGYDFTTDPNYLFTIESDSETEPGNAFKLDMELTLDVEVNERGPKIWFRCPEKIRGVFLLHYLVFHGRDMLARPGML